MSNLNISITESRTDFFERCVDSPTIYNQNETLKKYGEELEREIRETLDSDFNFDFDTILGPVSKKIKIENDDYIDNRIDEYTIEMCIERVFEKGNFWVVI